MNDIRDIIKDIEDIPIYAENAHVRIGRVFMKHECIEVLEKHLNAPKQNSTGYECFHCGHKTVAWDADFNYEDFCLEGEGIVHICHCTNCGAEIQYNIPTPSEEEDHACKES